MLLDFILSATPYAAVLARAPLQLRFLTSELLTCSHTVEIKKNAQVKYVISVGLTSCLSPCACKDTTTGIPTSVKERLGLLWWLEPVVVTACFPHWVPVFTILFSLRLVSRALPLENSRRLWLITQADYCPGSIQQDNSWYKAAVSES